MDMDSVGERCGQWTSSKFPKAICRKMKLGCLVGRFKNREGGERLKEYVLQWGFSVARHRQIPAQCVDCMTVNGDLA